MVNSGIVGAGGVTMQENEETIKLLREMRDVMVDQRNKYLEYLDKSDELYEKHFKRARGDTFEQWTFHFLVMFAAVALALWATGANK